MSLWTQANDEKPISTHYSLFPTPLEKVGRYPSRRILEFAKHHLCRLGFKVFHTRQNCTFPNCCGEIDI